MTIRERIGRIVNRHPEGMKQSLLLDILTEGTSFDEREAVRKEIHAAAALGLVRKQGKKPIIYFPNTAKETQCKTTEF